MPTPIPADLAIPKLNDYWPGQGGIYRGTHLLGGYLIESSDLLPKRYPFGIYGMELKDYSDLDGAENTRKLIEIGSPAARAAAEYTADGHSDFYLPSQRELMQAFLASGPRRAGSWAVSSTPCGSDFAWVVHFEDGRVPTGRRSYEFRVRPFRRFIASSL